MLLFFLNHKFEILYFLPFTAHLYETAKCFVQFSATNTLADILLDHVVHLFHRQQKLDCFQKQVQYFTFSYPYRSSHFRQSRAQV